MAVTYGPFSAGSGAAITQDFWDLFAQQFLHTGVIRGVLNELATYADSTGMQVKVPSGAAWMVGQLVYNNAQITLAIAAANATNPRIDRVVARRDTSASTITIAVTTGTPASSPVAPALLNTATVLDLELAQVLVPAAATTIASGNVTDKRAFTANVDLESVQALKNKTLTDTVLNGTAGGTAIGTAANKIAAGNHTHTAATIAAPALLGFFPGSTGTYAYSGGLPVSLAYTGGVLAGWSELYGYSGQNLTSVTLQYNGVTQNTTTYTYNGDGTISSEVHT